VNGPIVSIGIPTYNRAGSVERAIRSALSQSHAAIEIVVSDDASSDETEAVCRALVAQDARVRYERLPRNVGHAANFRRVFERSSGAYFMWLSDDDWLEPEYVSRCLDTLRGDPACSLVAGRGRYFREDAFAVQERAMNLTHRNPAMRVLAYFWQVDVNGALYGVVDRQRLAQLPFRELFGGDWVLVGALAAAGHVRTLEDVHLMRSISGVSSDATGLATGEFGLDGFRARNPHVWLAWTVMRQIGREEPAYRTVGGRVTRWTVGALAAVSILLRFTLVDKLRGVLGRLGLLPIARRAIEALRARRHR
jgi:hypothetical protein